MCFACFFFFFKQKTAYEMRISDWSSDVCSSDLLPPVIHVAGTNGKGSTCAYLRAILEAAGHRVHVYTSPHLVRFNERIVLAGQEIGDPAFAAVLEERSEEHTSELQSLMRISYAVFCLKKKNNLNDILNYLH